MSSESSSTGSATELTEKDNLGRALGRIASGVYIVSFVRDGVKDGMLSTFVMQSSFSPPVVVVSVNKKRPLLDVLKEGHPLAINVLSKKNMDAYKAFAKPFQEGMDRYEGLELLANEQNLPLLANCVSYIECKVLSYADAGDHQLLIAEAVKGAQLNEEEPMIHLRKNGFSY